MIFYLFGLHSTRQKKRTLFVLTLKVLNFLIYNLKTFFKREERHIKINECIELPGIE